MSKPVVSVARCQDYDLDGVQSAIERALAPLGGMRAFVSAGQRILLKPNLVRAMPPEKAATTHPSIVAAVARLVIQAGGHPIIFDSPGGPYTKGVLKNLYRKTQMDWAAEVSGAELNMDTGSQQVAHPTAQVLHRLDIVQPLLDVDAVINLPKLKTHNLTTLTMAVKNLFGVVPGALKISYHSKLREREHFCQGLLDILEFVRPVLNIMDAIVGMEGEGPSGGEPRPIGAIIAGSDALAVDVVGAAAVGFDPLQVMTTRMAIQRGLTSGRLEDLDLLGDDVTLPLVADFRRGIEASMDPGLLPRVLRGFFAVHDSTLQPGNEDALGRKALRAVSQGWIWGQLVAMPRATEKCVGCGFCVRHCPVDAIEIVDGIAHMDAKKCIRCYCCHELCPELAIELRRPLLGRLVFGK